jgi:hypothetical protein
VAPLADFAKEHLQPTSSLGSQLVGGHLLERSLLVFLAADARVFQDPSLSISLSVGGFRAVRASPRLAPVSCGDSGSCPVPRPVLELSATPCAATPAAREFALLENWLASCRSLQLPLHQIEAQQQSKGREVQRLLLQAHLQLRGDGDVGPALCLPLARAQGDGEPQTLTLPLMCHGKFSFAAPLPSAEQP